MISKIVKSLCVFCLTINWLSFGAEQDDSPYLTSWTTTAALETKGIYCDFHKIIAGRIAGAKISSSGLRGQDNVAAMAVSAHWGKPQNRRSVFRDLGYLISSILNVSIENPLEEPDGTVVLAVPDMFVGDRMRPDSMYRQNLVKRFLSFLISEEYTGNWGLLNELHVTRRVLASSRNDLKLKITTEQSEIPELSHSPNLGKVLHCEQTMLFKILTDPEILDQLVDGLISSIRAFGIEGFFENNPQITFDIVTYNDMCPKCFATCYHMQQRLQARINALLIDKLDRLDIFPEKTNFPVPVTILISSFRPFKLDDGSYTRGIADDFMNTSQYYTGYRFAIPQQRFAPLGHKRVLQIVNPWIEGGIAVCNAANICKDALALQQSLESYINAREKQRQKQALSQEEKKILKDTKKYSESLECNINGFIRDFRLPQFYDGLQPPSQCIDSIIESIIPINVMDTIPSCIEKLTALRCYTINMANFFDKMLKLLSRADAAGHDEGFNFEEIINLLLVDLPKILEEIRTDNISQGLLEESRFRTEGLIERCNSVFPEHARKDEFIGLLRQISERILSD